MFKGRERLPRTKIPTSRKSAVSHTNYLRLLVQGNRAPNISLIEMRLSCGEFKADDRSVQEMRKVSRVVTLCRTSWRYY
ncbi:hypothetical protein J6590_014448 [Homalodisca vitripennis]|nr:hypothetical protein J6590_014448 [Homalodisca vitripennis]